MSTIIGTVEEINGDFFAKDAQGNIVKLHVGDKLEIKLPQICLYLELKVI